MGEGWSRREFLRRSGVLAAGLGALPALLEACGSSGTSSSNPLAAFIGKPDAPVTLPLYSDNPAIANGLAPEKSNLRVLNYADYVSADVLKSFGDKYGITVEVTTYDSDAELIDKLRNGALAGDMVMSVAYNTFHKLIAAKILAPLNHSYLANYGNLLPTFQDPFYDKGGRYTVPYTVYGVGLDYRTDKVTAADFEAKGWGIVWDPKYKGSIEVLNDYREALSLAMLRKGLTDINTTDTAVIAQAGKDLQELTANGVKVDIQGYKDVPEGTRTIAEGYTGDMINGLSNLPQGTDPSVLGFWKPSNGLYPVNNDCMAVLKGAKNPVLAHLLIDYILDVEVAATNFQTNGYQPPLTALSADELIKRQLVPESLRSTVLSSAEIDKGLRILALPAAAEKAWNDAYSKFNSGA